MVRAGLLRHRVDIEYDAGTSRNAYGETTATWEKLATSIPASIEPLTGRDLWGSQQIQPDISHKVTIRWLDGVTAKMRILYGERTFYIEGPPKNADERNKTFELLCREATE